MGESHNSHRRHGKHHRREPDFLDALAYATASKEERRRIDEAQRRRARGREKRRSSLKYSRSLSSHSIPSRRPVEANHHHHHRRRHSFTYEPAGLDFEKKVEDGFPVFMSRPSSSPSSSSSSSSCSSSSTTSPSLYAHSHTPHRHYSSHKLRKETMRERFMREVKEIDRRRKEIIEQWRVEKDMKKREEEERTKFKDIMKQELKEMTKQKKEGGWLDKLKHGKLWSTKNKYDSPRPEAATFDRPSSNASHRARSHHGPSTHGYRPATPPRSANSEGGREATQLFTTPRHPARQSYHQPAPAQYSPIASSKASSAVTEWPGPFNESPRRESVHPPIREGSSHRGSSNREPSRRESVHEGSAHQGSVQGDSARRGSFRHESVPGRSIRPESSRRESIPQTNVHSRAIPKTPSKASSAATEWPGPSNEHARRGSVHQESIHEGPARRESVREGSVHREPSHQGSTRHVPVPRQSSRPGSSTRPESSSPVRRTGRPHHIAQDRPPSSSSDAMNAHRQCAQDFGIATNPYRDPVLATRTEPMVYKSPVCETEVEEDDGDGITTVTVVPDDSISCAFGNTGEKGRDRRH